MSTGMIVVVVFIGIIVALNWGSALIEKLTDCVEYMNTRKPFRRHRVPAVIAKLKKLRVVKTLTDAQIPQVKKHIEEMSTLINRHIETIHQHGETAVTLARSADLTTARMQYERKYAKQMDMINASVPQLITEADRISAFDEDYKQHVHDWILVMRESLEDYDPKHFEQMTRAGCPHSPRPSIDTTAPAQ